jgi:hypothetical protein
MKIRKLRTKKLAPGVIFESGVSSNPPIDSRAALFGVFNLVSLTHKHLTSMKALALNKQSHLFASKLAPKKKKCFLKDFHLTGNLTSSACWGCSDRQHIHPQQQIKNKTPKNPKSPNAIFVDESVL